MKIDPKTFRLVAGFLGGALLLIVVAISVLAGLGKDYPGILDNLATGCLTALVALLVSPHSDEPVSVTVADQPVAVDPAPAAAKRRGAARTDRGHYEPGGILIAVLVLILFLVLLGFLR